jgi:hypothetical protein
VRSNPASVAFLSLKTFCSFAWTNYLKVLANTLCTIGIVLVSNSARRNGHIVYLRNVSSPVRIPLEIKRNNFVFQNMNMNMALLAYANKCLNCPLHGIDNCMNVCMYVLPKLTNAR